MGARCPTVKRVTNPIAFLDARKEFSGIQQESIRVSLRQDCFGETYGEVPIRHPFSEEGQESSPLERKSLTEVAETLSCILPAL